MKILYIGVHSHIGWGAEYWLQKSFSDLDVELELLNYRETRKKVGPEGLKKNIYEKASTCDIIFLQRGDKLSPSLFSNINIPIVFWSTEPIQLKSDVDELLNSNLFSWIYIHSYSCLERVENEFSHIINKTSVMHNAAPKEIIKTEYIKSRFAIFNRNLSWRRKWWLFPSRKLYDGINGRYGEEYFNDLRESQISINIHYSNKNLDDFESGIFEAMASGCAVISEKLHPQTLIDLGLEDTIIQVDSPKELRKKLIELKSNHKLINEFQKKSIEIILNNTWENRAKSFINKFQEICH
ncbi:MAG: glycosyltransferase family 1 protein [Candidatus Marinimicrobia bacterium]|nr:glycosyltransferase family 1 protein [Candidatus Neomarinimicrobiota bacterium]